MDNQKSSSTTGVFAIFVVGGLIGSALMLLLAPASGKRARKRLRKASNRLQRRTAKNVYRTTKRVNKFVHTFLRNMNANLKERKRK